MPDVPHILLVNPWIHDFAAYDFWARPLGLLTLGGILRTHGFRVSYMDCLDRFHPRGGPFSGPPRFGRGPYRKTPIAKPAAFADVPRNFSRYGIDPSWFREDLGEMDPPDLVLCTSLMTYWYPGVVETLSAVRKVFPRVPVVLGGIYATLCSDHAVAHAGADRVVSGAAAGRILSLACEMTGWKAGPLFDPDDLEAAPYPALDLQRAVPFVPLLTSVGCPFHCPYCASGLLQPTRRRRSPGSVLDEMVYWQQRWDVHDFVFYDDALLVDAQTHALPLLEGIARSGRRVRLHTPNAVHIRSLCPETADLLRRAGCVTLRLGLETIGEDGRETLDEKVRADEFFRAAKHLHAAGFEPGAVGAYLLVGLPGQSYHCVARAIRVVQSAGIRPVLAHYSPIPHTAMWPSAVAASRYDLEKDPLYTNNAVLPCSKEPFSWKAITALKRMAGSSAQSVSQNPVRFPHP